MPRNGSGGFSLVTNSWNVATNGVAASAADWQALINDVATAVQQSISSDGQTPITGNLQMGGNRLTGLGAGSSTGQSLRFEQLFSQGALVDIASAGVMDIGTPLTNFLRVTGSTTITGFGTNYNGPRYLIFAAAVILTHSATLVLPGAANITTGVNDSLIAVPISGGWQVVAYQRASGLPAVAGPIGSSGITGAAASGANTDITSLGTVTTTTQLASDASTKIATTAFVNSTGRVVQTVEATPYTTYTSTAVPLPYDDTIPQNNEGLEIMTVTITPTKSTNRLRIEFNGYFAVSGSGIACSVALFQDATANALVAGANWHTDSAEIHPNVLSHEIAAGTTSPTTFRIRFGPSTGTGYVNGTNTARRFGGIQAARLRVTEVAA